MSKLLNLLSELPEETSDSTVAFLTEQFTVHRKNYFASFMAAVEEGREKERQDRRAERLEAVAEKHSTAEQAEGSGK